MRREPRIQEWSRVGAHFTTDVPPERFPLAPELHSQLVSLIGDEYATLEIDFESTGYYDPGRIYGDPEKCYPAEGDDERELVAAWLDVDGTRVELPRDLQTKLFEHFAKQIQEVTAFDDHVILAVPIRGVIVALGDPLPWM